MDTTKSLGENQCVSTTQHLPRGQCLFLGTFGARWGGLQVPVNLRAMLVGLPTEERDKVCPTAMRGGGRSRSAAPTFLGLGTNHPHTGKHNINSTTIEDSWSDHNFG